MWKPECGHAFLVLEPLLASEVDDYDAELAASQSLMRISFEIIALHFTGAMGRARWPATV